MPGERGPRDALRLELRLPGAVRVGEPVRFELHVANESDAQVELLLAGRPPAFDLIVRAPDGTPVWRRLEGEVIAMTLQIVRLPPGREMLFTHFWDQRDDRGRPVPPGDYVASGILPAEGRELRTEPAPLRVEEGAA